MAQVNIDLMEYANDAAARSAYVSSEEYTADLLTGGTASADKTVESPASNAFDDNTATYSYQSGGFPYIIKYDLGAGNAKIVTRYREYLSTGQGGNPKDWFFEGSNNDADWTVLDTVTGNPNSNGVWDSWHSFSNSTAYRYYRWRVTAGWGSICSHYELEAQGPILQVYSEATIKTEGSYSLKGFAKITDSLNDNIVKTIAALDLSTMSKIVLDIRSSRVGTNIQFGFGEVAYSDNLFNLTINNANAWETKEIDISGIAGTARDAVTKIGFKITNADADNTFYVDQLIAKTGVIISGFIMFF